MNAISVTAPQSDSVLAVSVLGFSPTERNLIGSVCKLSKLRAKSKNAQIRTTYHMIESADEQEADIFLVDADNGDVLQEWSLIRERFTSTPVILINREAREVSKAGEYSLMRNRLGALLLKLMDEIAERHLQENPASIIELDSVVPTVKRKQCLVVDDSQLMRTHMKLILREYDLDVDFSEDAETALKLLKDKHFDIIFLDVMLPEMDGYKACRLMKADPKIHNTPVVMLTSKRSPFNKIHGTLVGCDRYLTKPVDPAKVYKVLQEYSIINMPDLK